jgi:putative phosphoribosyl transferase
VQYQPRFRDRAAAGRSLACALNAFAAQSDVVVLGLARGGVAVGREVADALAAPFDVVVARKLGVPGVAEVALGAVAEGSRRVVDDPVRRFIGVPSRVVAPIAARERAEVERRKRVYRADRDLPDVAGRTIILVDDGLATGATLRAATLALRRRRPARVVVAVPVASAGSAVELQNEVDALIALVRPPTLGVVSDWYDDFTPVTDNAVLRLLGRTPVVAAHLPDALHCQGPAEREVVIHAGHCSVVGDLGLPDHAAGGATGVCRIPRGLVVLAHGGGSSRNSYRNRYLAGRLRLAGYTTLRLDLLTEAEREADAESAAMRFDIGRLTQRLIAAAGWAAGESVPGAERIILMGASTGAAAALAAAAELPGTISGVVARGGRVDLAGPALTRVNSPVLLVVGAADHETLQWNRWAMRSLPGRVRLAVVPDAGHAFEETGALGAVGECVVRWLDRLRADGLTGRLRQMFSCC